MVVLEAHVKYIFKFWADDGPRNGDRLEYSDI